MNLNVDERMLVIYVFYMMIKLCADRCLPGIHHAGPATHLLLEREALAATKKHLLPPLWWVLLPHHQPRFPQNVLLGVNVGIHGIICWPS